MGFADEVERKRRFLRGVAAKAPQQQGPRVMRQWKEVIAFGQEVHDYLVREGVPMMRAETLTWTTGGGPGRLAGPTYHHQVDVPQGWRVGLNGGWGYVVTPDGVLNSSWNGPSTRGRHGSLVSRVYIRPLQVAGVYTSVRDGDYSQRGYLSLNGEGHIISSGDSETPDTDVTDLITRSVAELSNSHQG